MSNAKCIFMAKKRTASEKKEAMAIHQAKHNEKKSKERLAVKKAKKRNG